MKVMVAYHNGDSIVAPVISLLFNQFFPLLIALTCGVFLGTSYYFINTVSGAFFAWLSILLLCSTTQSNNTQSDITFSLNWYHYLISGSACFAVACPWFVPVMSEYFTLSLPITLLWFAIISLYTGLQWVVTYFLFTNLEKFSAIKKAHLSLALAWLSAEVLFPKVFPWFLGNTQISFLHFVQSADIAGVSFVSFLMIYICSLLVHAVKNKELFKASVAFILFFTATTYGHFTIKHHEKLEKNGKHFNALLIQPDFDPAYSYEQKLREKKFEEIYNLSAIKQEEDIDLLIWPESSIGFSIWDKTTMLTPNSNKDPYPARTTPFIFGGQTRIAGPPQDGKFLFYNSAFLINQSGEILSRYDKQTLLPFAEYFPLSNFFPAINQLSPISYLLKHGKNQTVMSLTLDGGLEINFAPAICYEDMSPAPFYDVIKNSAANNKKTNILLGLASDIWFLDSNAVFQHHHFSRLRAIEFRKPLLRVATDGITALTSSTGKVKSELTPFSANRLKTSVPLQEAAKSESIFYRFGYKFIFLLSIFILIACCIRRLINQKVR